MRMKKYLILMRPLWSEMVVSLTQGMTPGYAGKKRKTRSKGATILLYLFLVGTMGFYSSMIGFRLTKALASVGAEDMIIRLISMAAPVFAVVFGVLQAIPMLYHESSLESLLVLPVKPAAITAAKLTQAFAPILLITAIFCYPALIVHGVITSRPWSYYAQTVPFMLFVTVAPFAITAVFVLIMMRYTKLARNKDRFQLITSIVTVLLVVAFSLAANLQTSGSSEGGGIFADPATGVLLNRLVRFFPASAFSAAMLIRADTWNTVVYGLISLGINGLAVAILLFVADRIYIRGVLDLSGSKRAKPLTASETVKQLAPRSAYRALVSKEWKLLLRTPAFFVQTVFSALFMPLVMIVSFSVSFSRINGPSGIRFNPIAFLRLWIAAGAWWDSFWILVLAVGSFAVFMSGLTLVSASAISRQGAAFQYSKLIPVPLRTQVLAWLTPGMSLTVFIWIALTTSAAILLRMPFYLALIIFFIVTVNTYFIQLLGFWTDMKAPALHWSHEMEAVKNTRASLVSSLGNLVYIGLSVAIAFLARSLTGRDPVVTGFIVLAFYVISAALMSYLVRNTARRLFQTIEL